MASIELGTMTINGRRIRVPSRIQSFEINRGQIYVDGVDRTSEFLIDGELTSAAPPIHLSISGCHIERLSVDSDGPVDVRDSSIISHLSTTSGNVTVHGPVGGRVSTMGGSVRCTDITGPVSTMSGSVTAESIHGGTSTMSGNITKRPRTSSHAPHIPTTVPLPAPNLNVSTSETLLSTSATLSSSSTPISESPSNSSMSAHEPSSSSSGSSTSAGSSSSSSGSWSSSIITLSPPSPQYDPLVAIKQEFGVPCLPFASVPIVDLERQQQQLPQIYPVFDASTMRIKRERS